MGKKTTVKQEVKVVDNPEVTAIDKKIKELEEKFTEATKSKQGLIKQLKGLDEEILKLQGSYQTLKELQNDLVKTEVVEPEDEEVK